MKTLLCLLVFFLAPTVRAVGPEPAAFPAQAYLDLEDGEVISIFSAPGQNWKSCSADRACSALGWPDNTAKLRVLGKKRAVATPDIYDPQTKTMEEYYEVEFFYERIGPNGRRYKQSGRGWVDAASVRFKKMAPIYSTAAPSPTTDPNCPPEGVPGGKLGSERPSRLVTPLANKAVIATAEALMPAVGHCATRDTRTLASLTNQGNHYDTHVLPALRKVKLPDVTNQEGERLTRKQLIDIDSLARMLYSETGKCFKHGLHHPMAIAKVAVNRVHRTEQHGQFMAGPHAADKGPLARIT